MTHVYSISMQLYNLYIYIYIYTYDFTTYIYIYICNFTTCFAACVKSEYAACSADNQMHAQTTRQGHNEQDSEAHTQKALCHTRNDIKTDTCTRLHVWRKRKNKERKICLLFHTDDCNACFHTKKFSLSGWILGSDEFWWFSTCDGILHLAPTLHGGCGCTCFVEDRLFPPILKYEFVCSHYDL